MIFLILICCSIFFCCLMGIYDALLYGRRGADSFTWDEHIIMVLIRSCFPLGILLGMWIVVHKANVKIDVLEFIVFCWCFCFLYSFWHNGCYYCTRAAIEGIKLTGKNIKKYWVAYSLTDTSPIHFTYTQRFIQFLICILTIILYKLFNQPLSEFAERFI